MESRTREYRHGNQRLERKHSLYSEIEEEIWAEKVAKWKQNLDQMWNHFQCEVHKLPGSSCMWTLMKRSPRWWQVSCLGDQLSRKHLAKMERQEDERGEYGPELSRRGGKGVCVGLCPWDIPRRGSLHSHHPDSLSICYCYLLETILGSWNVSQTRWNENIPVSYALPILKGRDQP